MRRRSSTSFWEYRRVPLGERLGSISPRASYMRSVCGCISASSAATEIMKTPRSASSRRSAAGPSCRLRAPSAIATHSPSRSGPSGPEERGPRVRAVQRVRKLLDRVALLVGELLRHVHSYAVVDVSATRALGPRWALFAQSLDGAVLGAGSEPDRLRSVQRGHLDVTALDGLGHGDRQVHLEVPIRTLLENGGRSDASGDVEIAARTASVAGLALARQPDPAAVVDPRRDVDAVALRLLSHTAS